LFTHSTSKFKNKVFWVVQSGWMNQSALLCWSTGCYRTMGFLALFRVR
jgi:hypothetical protein